MTEHFCYVRSKEFSWVPATLEKQDEETATVSIPVFTSEEEIVSGISADSLPEESMKVSLSDYPNATLPLQNVDETGRLVTVGDLVDLMFLHEPAIMYNLKARHLVSKPYTRTGNVMIAVNPYRWINRLYSPERRNLYSQELVFEPQQQEHGVSLEPHVYEISASAYKGMALEGRHQSILVSGESGAGKTETVKICLNHLASIQSGPESRGMALSGDTSHVVQRVLDSNPLLEAFGNAKTRRNDNSSRFGKYIQLQFHRPPNEDPSSTTVNIPACHLVGSSSQVYLLEKSRVVHHDPEERTFHIFYQLLAAPDSTKRKFWKHLEGKSNVSFSFVGKTDTNKIEGKTDGVRFQQTVDALQLVGIRAKKLDYLMQAMCAIMQMGNITFRDGPTADSSAIKSQKELETLSDITGVPVKDLEDALTYRNIVVNQERTRVPLRKKVAKDFLDALAKQVYASLFLWLVQSINEATCATKQENSMPDISVENLGIIGLLDIFGFESFQTNGFEQLCINFANEMLQSKFTSDVFQSVFAEYKFEGLSLDRIHYDDNSDVLDLLQTPRTGVLSVLNEECILPKGNDEAFCRKAIVKAKAAESDVILAKPAFRSYNFGVRHYAGDVIYDCRGFITKNLDTLPADLLECFITKSTNPIIVLELSNGRDYAAKPSGGGRRRTSALVAPTVWTKYRTQLVDLMANLEESQNLYIRCIKPNAQKLPKLMEHDMTLEQLRSAGVIAAVTMSRAAFPNRLEHMKVLERFAPIWQLFWSKRSGATQKVQSKKLSDHENVETLLSAALKPLEVEVDDTAQPAYAVGKTRTYFVAGALEYLEALRFKGLEICATVIESLARGIVVRKTLNHNYFVARIRSRQRIQMWWRCMQAKTAFLILLREEQEKKNRLRLQCWFRKILALKVAAHLRGDVEKKRRQKGIKKRTANKRTAAAARIQAVVRGKNQRAKYTSERGIIYKYHGLEDEVDRLEQELLEMEAAFKEGERDHAKELKELEEERLKQSHGYHEERFDESFASLGSSIASFNSPNSGRRKSMFESDEVAQQRKANKKLRKQIHTLEQEQKALGQNAKALSKSNDDARNAIVDAKNVYLKLMVRNNRNQSEAEGLWEDLHSKARRKNARLNQLEVEKQTRSRYLKTVKKAVKLVKKRIPDTRLATDVDRVVSMYISTESCRLGKVHGVSRQDSTLSLSSITSDTEHSDSESESPDNGSALS